MTGCDGVVAQSLGAARAPFESSADGAGANAGENAASKSAGASGSIELDAATALQLCELTSEFYRANAKSFSQTRQSHWRGWERVLAAIGVERDERPLPKAASGFSIGLAGSQCDDGAVRSGIASVDRISSSNSFRVFDLACGNLRFERWLVQQLPDASLSCFAVDNCDPLVEASVDDELPHVAFQNLNAIDALASDSLAKLLEASTASCDLAVSFGFMHHVPLERWRASLLRALASRVRPGGHVVVSFWRFLNSEKLAKKASETTACAQVELGIPDLPPNDFLLGWQETRGLYRYCHHFDDAEIDRLLAAVADVAQPVARFAADGKTGNLNEYVVMRVR